MYSPLVHGGSRTMNKSSTKRSAPGNGQRSQNKSRNAKKRQDSRPVRPGGPPRSRGRSQLNGEEQGIRAPTAQGSVQGSSRPLMFSDFNSGDLRVRVRYREYITDITGSVAFAVQQFNINPGLATIFPWLSGLAALFESYKFNKLTFQYRTESATTQVGKILMNVDWDVLDSPPVSKQAMMQERTKADGPTWVDLNLNCDLPDLLKFGVQRFVRSSSAPASSDLKTYDVGMLNVGSQGVTNAPVIGELWVEYDVELITPHAAPIPASEKVSGAGGSISNAEIFGATPTIVGNLGVTASGNTLTFPSPGQYLVEYELLGTFSTATINSGTATVTNAYGFVTSGGACVFTLLVEVTAVNQTVIISSPSGTVTGTNVRIAPYSYSNA